MHTTNELMKIIHPYNVLYMIMKFNCIKDLLNNIRIYIWQK